MWCVVSEKCMQKECENRKEEESKLQTNRTLYNIPLLKAYQEDQDKQSSSFIRRKPLRQRDNTTSEKCRI